MAVAPPFTALVGASSIRLRLSTNGQREQRSKAPANIAGEPTRGRETAIDREAYRAIAEMNGALRAAISTPEVVSCHPSNPKSDPGEIMPRGREHTDG
jgi:hypothetical protein